MGIYLHLHWQVHYHVNLVLHVIILFTLSLSVVTLQLTKQAFPTRWNSVYDMLSRLCQQQAAIGAVLHSQGDLFHLEHIPVEWHPNRGSSRCSQTF